LNLRQSPPVIYHRSIVRIFFPFLPALVLLPFLLMKPNRQFRAFIILAPSALITVIALIGKSLSQVRLLAPLALAFSEAYPYIAVLASSLCILCLILHWLPGWPLRRKISLIPALYLLPGMLILFITQADAKIQGWIYPAAYGLVSLILLTSGLLAGRYCRKRWKLWRFSLNFFAWNVLFLAILVALAIWVEIRSLEFAELRFLQLLIPAIVVPMMAAGILSIIAFPFILTAFLSPLYRARLMAVFKVTPIV
jgi:hypothetical protein